MSDFGELGIEGALLERLRQLGYRRPTALQEDAVPVIARGTSAAGAASAGSGKTLAYGLGLAARLDAASSELQALVLRPTDDRALKTAEALQRLLRPTGLRATAIHPTRAGARPSSQVVVASPSAALASVEASVIKLAGLTSLVVDGVSAMLELGGDALETLSGQVPKDAQRVVFTAALNSDVEDWMERHARRARRFTDVPAGVEPLADAAAEYFAAPRHQWLAALSNALESTSAKGEGRGGNVRSIIHCRLEGEAGDLADRLSARGFDASPGDSSAIRIVCDDETDREALSISWGAPSDLVSLKNRVAGSAGALILLEPEELPHLERLASPLKLKLKAGRAPPETEALRSTQHTRDQLREAAASRDLEPYVLMLGPLLEEFTPVEIAAAAAALLRERAPAEPEPQLPAWTRLYLGVGKRDGIRPGDLVGAITGEAPIAGDKIGRIDVRENYSLVEVTAPFADQVIKSMSATTIRGKPAKVRVFRE